MSTSEQLPTATLESARDHARSQVGLQSVTAPTVPSTAASNLPEGIEASTVVWDETIGSGNYATRAIARGTHIRITDLDGGACIALAVHRADHTPERLNVADTVKVQWQAYLGTGTLLLSDMGRVLMTVVDDTAVGHDALCGCLSPAAASERYGDGSASGPTPSTRDLLCLGLAKHGLGRRDLPPIINLFTSVRVDEDGSLRLGDGGPAGAHIELRSEMDVIVTLASGPHPLDDRDEYSASTVRITAWRDGLPDAATDPFRTTTPERRRAFENTDELLRGRT